MTKPLKLALGTLSLLGGAAVAQTVTMATHYPAENVAVLEPCFAQYRDETGVEVVHQQIPYGDYLQTILTARLGGQSPDIYHVYSIWAAQLVDNGLLAVPPEEVLGFVTDNYVGSTVDAITIDDQTWGVPTEVANYLLIYNKQIFAEAGIDAPPATWDELLEVAAATTTGERTRFALATEREQHAAVSERVEAALDALHDSDARMAAVAEQLGGLQSTIRSSRATSLATKESWIDSCR